VSVLSRSRRPTVVGVEPVGEELDVMLVRHLESARVGLSDILGCRTRTIVAIHEKRHQSKLPRRCVFLLSRRLPLLDPQVGRMGHSGDV
jgi:hypothetical protein